jgi:hypothetical protein
MEPRDFEAFAGRVRDASLDEDHPTLMKPLEEGRVNFEFTFRDDKVSYVRELAALSRD